MADLFLVKTMTSLEVAEVTGKAHSNVMRDIRNILEQLEDRGAFKFELTSYVDKSNRESPCYQLTQKDCLLLASGYDANLRAKIINRWEELETEKRNGGIPRLPQTYLEALEALVVSEREKERLRLESEEQRRLISVLQSKADFADSFLRQPGDITIDDLAAVLQQKGYRSKGSNTLRQWMRQKGYLIKRGARKNKPTQKSMDKKLMRLVYESSANGTVFITGNGMKHFIGEFAKLHASKTLSLNFAK